MTRRFTRFMRRHSIALVALFFALTGTTFAAANALGPNTVGAKQLKKNAVTNKKIAKNAVTGIKVKDNALTGADINEATLGTVPSATNATNATNSTNSAQLGGVVASHYMRPGATLASGDTETGVYGAAATNGAYGVTGITFVPKLAAAPTAKEYVTTTTATCPGVGQATAGRLCIYQGWIFGMTSHCIGSPTGACGGNPTVDGAALYFDSTQTGGNTTGTWAYKAP